MRRVDVAVVGCSRDGRERASSDAPTRRRRL